MAFSDLSTENQGKVKLLNAILEKKLEGLDPKNKEHREQIMAVRDEIKNHEFYLDFKKDISFCGALSKSNRICTAKPWIKDDGSTNGKCAQHGGKSTGAKTEEGKKRSLAQLQKRSPVHGLYTDRLWNELTPEEKDFMAWFEESVKEQYMIDNAIEETSLQMMAFEAVKHFRMINTQPFKETKTGMQMVQKFLRFIEVQGWRKRDLDEEQKSGVKADVFLKLLDELPDEKENSSEAKIKRIK
jgi:hypothetical protein